ncbi:MAG: sulfotransferase [Bacteroidota bacterium]
MFCRERTGSTWLHTLLNSHLNIHSDGEIVLDNSRRQFPQPFNVIAYRKMPRMIKAQGLKIFYDDHHYQQACQTIIQDKSIKIILLRRKDILAQFVSLKLAKTRSEWSGKSTDTQRIEVNLREFEKYQREYFLLERQLEEQLQGHSILEVQYERLIEHEEKELRQIQSFLNVAKKSLQSTLKRQSTVPINEKITNWEEVQEYLIAK